jgi:tetratricopeptide (TPR) repeat protein
MNYKNGVKFWMRGVKTNPERPMLYNGLALSLQIDGKMELSEKTLLKSIKIDPNVYDTHNRLANLYYNMGNKERALEHFYESYRLRPDVPESTINLAVVLRELRRYNDAAEILKNALRFDEKNTVFYQNVIDNYKAAGNYDSAYKYIRMAESKGISIELNKFLLDWGSYLSSKNDQKGAIAKTKEVLNNEPENLQALNQIGVYYAKSGDFQQAISNWEKALRINPKFLPSLQNFYKFYLANKMYDKALIYADLIEKAGGNIPDDELKRLRGMF